jgi:hypothetical protein
MKHKKLKLSVLLLLGFGLTGMQAQKAVLTNGSVALGSGGSMSYSIGQIVYTTNTGTNGSIAQGVQQPFEIFVGLEEGPGSNISCTVYPNPASAVLTLKVENLNNSVYTYSLYDLDGKLLANKKITGNETSIDISQLVAATYFLKVTDNMKVVTSFKIIKN